MFRSILVLSLAAGCAAPSFSQSLIAPEVQAAFARPQQLVDIGGRRLNLHCSGSGPITVVFDAPSGDAGWSWFEVQPHVAKRTRACVYDRAGLGFSDPSPRPGTSGNAVDDLHRLLGAAGVAPPYLMVGSSYGGANAQLYAYRYPGEVAGLVLLEPQHEDETERLDKASGHKLKGLYATMAQMEAACLAEAEKGFAVGSAAWTGCIGGLRPQPGRALGAAMLAVHASAPHWRARVSEERHYEVGNAELRAARKPFGALPLTVLSRSMPENMAPGQPQSAANKATEQENLAIQKEIAALSSRGRQQVVPGTGHIIQAARPDAVVAAIEQMLDTALRQH